MGLGRAEEENELVVFDCVRLWAAKSDAVRAGRGTRMVLIVLGLEQVEFGDRGGNVGAELQHDMFDCENAHAIVTLPSFAAALLRPQSHIWVVPAVRSKIVMLRLYVQDLDLNLKSQTFQRLFNMLGRSHSSTSNMYLM